MQPIITTSKNKDKAAASHKKSSSNVSLPSEERGRGSKTQSDPGSRSAVPTTPAVAPRPLVLDDAPRAPIIPYSPPMFAQSGVSMTSSGQSGIEIPPRGPKKGEPSKPLITLIHEGRGGTFYCGKDVMQKAIANTRIYAENFRQDQRNKARAEEGEIKSDYFLLTDTIGTETLASCVGLFFLIGRDRLFFARILVWVGDMAKFSLKPVQAEEVTGAVLSRLREMSEDQLWTPKDVVRKSLTIANGHDSDPAFAVRDAVGRFLGVKNPEKHLDIDGL